MIAVFWHFNDFQEFAKGMRFLGPRALIEVIFQLVSG